MKGLRFLLLGMAICLASGVKAQFYDSADDIYYYVEYKDGSFVDNGKVLIFNFDGQKACVLDNTTIGSVKDKIKSKSDYYEEKVETTDYNYEYVYYDGTSYQHKGSQYSYFLNGTSKKGNVYTRYTFSSNRNFMYNNSYKIETSTYSYIRSTPPFDLVTTPEKTSTIDMSGGKYKRVDKSFFRVGRSRTPSGTMHE